MDAAPGTKNFVLRDPLKVRLVSDAIEERMTNRWPKVDIPIYGGTPNPNSLETIVALRLGELETLRADAEKVIDAMKRRYVMPPEMTDDEVTMDWMVNTVNEICRDHDNRFWMYLCMPREPINWSWERNEEAMSADEYRVVRFIACYIAHYEPDMLANICGVRSYMINTLSCEAKQPATKEGIITLLELRAANGMEIHYLMRSLIMLRQWIRAHEARAPPRDGEGGAKKKPKTN